MTSKNLDDKSRCTVCSETPKNIFSRFFVIKEGNQEKKGFAVWKNLSDETKGEGMQAMSANTTRECREKSL
jgi:hypothetical protein